MPLPDLLDQETGWYRRWYFLARLTEELSRADKDRREVSLIYCRLPALSAWKEDSRPRVFVMLRLGLLEREAGLDTGFFGRLSEEEFGICVPACDDFRVTAIVGLLELRLQALSTETAVVLGPRDGRDAHGLLEAARGSFRTEPANNMVDLEQYRRRRDQAA